MDEFSNQAMILQFRDSPKDPRLAETNRKTVMDALETLRAGDADGWWSIFDPDVVFHEAACLPYGGAHRGLEATKQAYRHLSGLYSHMHSVFEAILAAEDIVIIYQNISFTVRANGNTGTLPVSEVLRFRDGKVVEWRACYFDSSMVATALAGQGAN